MACDRSAIAGQAAAIESSSSLGSLKAVDFRDKGSHLVEAATEIVEK